MSFPAAMVLVLALIALCVTGVVAAGIVRNGLRLAKTALTFAEEMGADVAAIAREAERASERAGALSERMNSLRR